MASIRALAMQNIGRRVIVHSTYGIHDGILHHCDDNGMYLQLMRGRAGVVSKLGTEANGIITLDGIPADEQVSEVFWPFFFIPWLAAGALYPWGYWW
jgi:hypothetical protein